MIDPIQQTLREEPTHSSARAASRRASGSHAWRRPRPPWPTRSIRCGRPRAMSENLGTQAPRLPARGATAPACSDPAKPASPTSCRCLPRTSAPAIRSPPTFRGTLKNFIAEINPPGDRESTGPCHALHHRAGHQRRDPPGGTAHPLTETDLVKILGNSFLSDFDPNNRKLKLPEDDAIRSADSRRVARGAGQCAAAAPGRDRETYPKHWREIPHLLPDGGRERSRRAATGMPSRGSAIACPTPRAGRDVRVLLGASCRSSRGCL